MKPLLRIAAVFLLLFACTQPVESPQVQVELPSYIDSIPWPDGRVPSVSEVQLGEQLFHSKLLSLDSSISCASCHLPNHALADITPVSGGIHSQNGFRNTPSLFNVAWKPHFFYEGGSNSIERTTLGPMLSEEEMFVQAADLMNRLRSTPVLHNQFVDIFSEDYDYKEVVTALSSYQRTLISLDSDWDAYQAGNPLTDMQQKGLELFNSDSLNCSSCHVPPFFTDFSFHDLGIPLAQDPDFGRGRFTFDSTDFYSFSTQSLRNVELTGPYMHDGSIPTLDSVIRFYEVGGGSRENELQPFQLNDDERLALLEFLKALTGKEQLEKSIEAN